MIPGLRVTLGHSCTVQGTADVRIVYDSTAAKVIGPELLEVGRGGTGGNGGLEIEHYTVVRNKLETCLRELHPECALS